MLIRWPRSGGSGQEAGCLSVCPCTCLASILTETVGAHQCLSASLSQLTRIHQTPLVSVQQHRPVLPPLAAVLDGSRGLQGYFWTHRRTLWFHRGHVSVRVPLITLCISGLLHFHADCCHCDQLLNQRMMWSYFVRTYLKIWCCVVVTQP